MKAIGSVFLVNFRLAIHNAKRTISSDVKSATNPMDNIKPHARSGILSAISKDENGFPSYIILKETSPILRLVSTPFYYL